MSVSDIATQEPMWEFPKIRGTLFWGPYNENPTISGTILWSPIFGNSHALYKLKTPSQANRKSAPLGSVAAKIKFSCEDFRFGMLRLGTDFS